jgi:hypothetical protein
MAKILDFSSTTTADQQEEPLRLFVTSSSLFYPSIQNNNNIPPQWSSRCVSRCPLKFPSSSSSLSVASVSKKILDMNLTQEEKTEFRKYFVPSYDAYNVSNNELLVPSPNSPKILTPISSNTYPIGNHHCVDEIWDGIDDTFENKNFFFSKYAGLYFIKPRKYSPAKPCLGVD